MPRDDYRTDAQREMAQEARWEAHAEARAEDLAEISDRMFWRAEGHAIDPRYRSDHVDTSNGR